MRRPNMIARFVLPIVIAASIGLFAAMVYTAVIAIPDLHGQAKVWGKG